MIEKQKPIMFLALADIGFLLLISISVQLNNLKPPVLDYYSNPSTPIRIKDIDDPLQLKIFLNNNDPLDKEHIRVLCYRKQENTDLILLNDFIKLYKNEKKENTVILYANPDIYYSTVDSISTILYQNDVKKIKLGDPDHYEIL